MTYAELISKNNKCMIIFDKSDISSLEFYTSEGRFIDDELLELLKKCLENLKGGE
jgi:hypothetical protein